MQYITIGLPEELTEALARPGGDISRAALEALATEAYQERKISHAQLRQLLRFETRMQVDSFLKDRGVELEHSYEDLQRDLETLTRLGA
jgi:hypothetical protein